MAAGRLPLAVRPGRTGVAGQLAAGTAGPAMSGIERGPAVATVTAVTDQTGAAAFAARPTGAAGHRGVATLTAVTAVTDQPGRAAVAAGLPRSAGSAVAAIAVQQARQAGRPDRFQRCRRRRSRSAGGATAPGWAR